MAGMDLICELPIFSEDLEKRGIPAGLIDLKESFDASDGILVASPEYNGSMSPLLVNAITWLSRAVKKEDKMYSSFKGKAGLVMSASPGGLGGLRSLGHSRELLQNMGTRVIPEQVAIGGAFNAFDENLKLKNDGQRALWQDALERLFEESRSVANAEATCGLVEKMGEFGKINIASRT